MCCAARQGEVRRRRQPIVTIMDLTQTWVYAPLPETQADAVKLGDSLRVVMPSGATVQGKVIAKSALADFATQRDVKAAASATSAPCSSSSSSPIPASASSPA